MARRAGRTARSITRPPRAGRTRRARTRLSANEARDAILRAAEKRVLEVGPNGLRLQDIAKAVGVSHPTVLHHFGNRDALVNAVVMRAMDTLQSELLACFVDLEGDPDRLAQLALARIDRALRTNGHARLLAWLALAKVELPGETPLRRLVDVVARARTATGATASIEDAQLTVLLTTATMFGTAIVGGELCRQLGLPDTERALERLRTWFARMLVRYLTARSGGAGA